MTLSLGKGKRSRPVYGMEALDSGTSVDGVSLKTRFGTRVDWVLQDMDNYPSSHSRSNAVQALHNPIRGRGMTPAMPIKRGCLITAVTGLHTLVLGLI